MNIYLYHNYMISYTLELSNNLGSIKLKINIYNHKLRFKNNFYY